MEFIYILLLAYLGLWIGRLLNKLANEEIKPNLKAFLKTQKILITTITILFAFYMPRVLYMIPSFLALAFLAYYLSSRHDLGSTAYALLGFVFFLSYTNRNMFLLQTSLITMYGFVTGTIEEKWHLEFLIIAAILFFVF